MVTSKDVLEIIDKELEKFSTKTEFAKEKLKLSKTDFNSLMRRLKGNGGGFNYNIKILNLLGYEVVLKRKKRTKSSLLWDYLFFKFITFASSSNFKILIFLSSVDNSLWAWFSLFTTSSPIINFKYRPYIHK